MNVVIVTNIFVLIYFENGGYASLDAFIPFIGCSSSDTSQKDPIQSNEFTNSG